MLDINSKEIKFGLEAVQKASLLVKDIQNNLTSEAITKKDKSPVTIADFSAQALIGKLLQEHLPDDLLVGEESGDILSNPDQTENLNQIVLSLSQYYPNTSREDAVNWINIGNSTPTSKYWVLDPIDGTKGFLRGNQYAVALALIIDSVIEIGIIGCPNLTNGHILDPGGPGSLLIAQRGKGTWLTSLNREKSFKRLEVSQTTSNSEARLLRSFEAGHTNAGHLDQIKDIMGVESEPIRLDSQAKYSILASGNGELIFRLISPKMPNYKEKIWDQAPGAIIVTEAGGKITDLDGKPLDFSQGKTLAGNRGVLASNGYLHSEALKAIKKTNA